MQQNRVVVIGAGLAGAEACWQIARRGIEVDLYEMRPKRKTGAHLGANFAELVCSNSFGSTATHTASLLLKQEIETLGGFVLRMAFDARVDAGASLAVDREKFSQRITDLLKKHPRVQRIHTFVLHPPGQATETLVCTDPPAAPRRQGWH